MVQVFELSGGDTLTQLGNDVTSDFEAPTIAITRPSNRALVFNGAEYIYHRDTIRERDSGGVDTWGVVETFASQSSALGYSLHTGLYEITNNGGSLLVGAYLSAGGPWDVFSSSDGTVFTTTSVTPNLSTGAILSECIFNNKIFVAVSASFADVVVFDPIAATADYFSVGRPTSNKNIDFCVVDNTLFMAQLDNNSGGGLFQLMKYQGGTFVNIGTFPNIENLTTAENGSLCLFTNNTDLFAIIPGSEGGSEGQKCYRITDPGLATQSIIDVTAAGGDSTNGVIPAALQPGGGTLEDASWFSFIDSETDAANPAVYLMFLSGPGQAGSYQTYAFTDFNTTLTAVGSGGVSADILIPNEKRGGGSRVITGTSGNKIYADIVDHDELAGGNVRIYYRVYGSGADVTGELVVSGGQSIADTVVAITAATGGSSSASGGNIIDITPDDGATLYTATFSATGANISPGGATLILEVN